MGRTLTAVNSQSAACWIAQLPPGRSQYTPPLGLYWQPISGSKAKLTEKYLGRKSALFGLCQERAHASSLACQDSPDWNAPNALWTESHNLSPPIGSLVGDVRLIHAYLAHAVHNTNIHD